MPQQQHSSFQGHIHQEESRPLWDVGTDFNALCVVFVLTQADDTIKDEW